MTIDRPMDGENSRCTDDEELISVIIPAFNRTRLLGRAISSVLGQTYANLELIIIDDGSTKDVKQVIGEFNDIRLSYHRREENLGISAARNHGIAKSKGKYVAFLDSDDEWKDRKLECQLDRLRCKGQGYGVCYTLRERVDDSSGKYVEGPNYCQEGNVLNDLLHVARMGASSLLVKRSVLEQVKGFDPTISWGEDWDFAIRLAERSMFACVTEPLTIYHLHDQGRVTDKIEGNPCTADSYMKIYQKNKKLFQTDRKAWGGILLLIGYFKASCGDYKEARRAFIASAFHDPFQRLAYLSLLRLIQGWEKDIKGGVKIEQ